MAQGWSVKTGDISLGNTKFGDYGSNGDNGMGLMLMMRYLDAEAKTAAVASANYRQEKIASYSMAENTKQRIAFASIGALGFFAIMYFLAKKGRL